MRGLVFFVLELIPAGAIEFANRCLICYDGDDAVTPVIASAPGHPGPGLKTVCAFDRACVASSTPVIISIDLLEPDLLALRICLHGYAFRCLALDVGEYACF